MWKGGSANEASLLANAYLNSLQLAVDNNVKTIAFPNISTGVYGYPKKEAAEIAVTTVKKFITHDHILEEVIFICYDNENHAIYKEVLQH